MPFTDLKGAARLVQRIDEILALVQSWPVSRAHENRITGRLIPDGGLTKYEELDAKVGALMNALGMSFPPSVFSSTSARYCHGYTAIRLIRSTEVDYPGEWERRLIAVRHSAQEIVDVADEPEKNGPLMPDNVDVRDLCNLLAKHAGGSKSDIQIARDFTKEKLGNDKKAKSLLRQACRYRHLWDRADK